MKVIEDMTKLAEDWESDLKEIGCEIPDST